MDRFKVFRSVVLALFIRELKTRFGESRIGYIWVIVEPLIHILVMLILFSVFMGHAMPEVPFSLFLVTGMVPYFLFKNIVNSVMNSVPANKALFSYRPVRPIAVYVARTLVETMIYVAIFISIIFGMMWFGIEDITIGNPLELLFVLGMLIVLGLTIGIVLSIVTHKFPFLKMLVGVFMTLLYFISGVMFPLWVIPSQYLPYLLCNPVLHLIELFRESFFTYYPLTDGVSIGLPIVSILVFGYIGLWFYEKREIYLKSST
ncbi:MAG: ABC transporter permease [Sulfuricurvum sp.]